MNNIINLNDLDTMSNEELSNIQNKIQEKRVNKLEKQVIEIVDSIKKINKQKERIELDIDKISNDNKKLKEDNKELKAKVFVLRNDQNGKYNEYKDVAKTRINKLVREKGTIENILFYQSFIQKLHNDVSNILGVSNTGNIQVEDVETAKGIAGKWRPNKKYLRDKYNEYNKKFENGILDGEKLRAFVKYMKKTKGGRKFEF